MPAPAHEDRSVNAASTDVYVTSLDEVTWGVMLIALTMVIHGFGVIVTLRTGGALQRRQAGRTTFFAGISPLIVGTWILVLVHLVEVLLWALFFWLRGTFPNASLAFYYTLMQYTTVGSEYNLPNRWRLLGGMVAMAGLLTVAWSTSVLFMMAQAFQSQQLAARSSKRGHDDVTGAGDSPTGHGR
jgi:hypothetical protein